MIVHSPLQAACDDCGAPFAAPCDTACPSAISNRIDSALADEDSATNDGPCCTDPWCPCRANQCTHCSTTALCADCRALLNEELADRAEDAAYDTHRQEYSR